MQHLLYIDDSNFTVATNMHFHIFIYKQKHKKPYNKYKQRKPSNRLPMNKKKSLIFHHKVPYVQGILAIN